MTFQDILDNNGIPYLTEGNHHCRPGWIQMDCPFCGKGSGRFHMGYSIEGRYMNCWRCRGHGVVDTLAELLDIGWREAKKLLEGIIEGPAKEREDKRGKLVLPKGLGELSRAHRDYLRGRGFEKPRALAERWSLQGLGFGAAVKTPEGKRVSLAWRIFIPYIEGGEVVSWTTRSISSTATQRYIAAPQSCEALDHKALLFGEQLVRGHSVIAVEGEFDAMRVGPGCVGVGGTAFKRAQVLRLSRYLVRVVCFDNEPDAQTRARELCDMLAPFSGETINVNLDAEDPGNASDKEINQLRSVAGL